MLSELSIKISSAKSVDNVDKSSTDFAEPNFHRKKYRNTLFQGLNNFETIMLTLCELECLFQNFIWVFIFGHLFLSIFQNQIDFWESFRDQFFSP